MKKILVTSATNSEGQAIGIVRSVPARVEWARDWQHWTPYAAVAWSLVSAALGLYWVVSGFAFDPKRVSGDTSVVGQLGPVVAWVVVLAAGFPAAAVGTAMLRGVRRFRPLLLTAGAVLAAFLLLCMADLTLLAMLAYIPYVVVRLLIGADVGFYVNELSQSRWTIAHELLCLAGGFLWLAATVSYARQSTGACLICGRWDGPEGWNSPDYAARWGRIAVYVAMIAPVFYAVTRYAWAVGIPLGMSEEHWRIGQELGRWISGLSLANVGLVGAVLMLGLVQRWGEVFPRWMIGLAGRRVPIALAMVPASIVSVLLIVAGFAILSRWAQMADAAAASGEDIWIVVGPTALFPVWGAALAVATLGYYYRRRGPCGICGRGTPGNRAQPQ